MVLADDVARRVEGWNYSPEERARVQLLAAFNGCAADRSTLRAAVLEALGGLRLYPDGEPDFSHVLTEDDPGPGRCRLAWRWPASPDCELNEPVAMPSTAEINRQILRMIYGGD